MAGRFCLTGAALFVAAIVLPQDVSADADTDGPRAGKYLILSYGATTSAPLNLGSVVLEKGTTYKVFLPGDKPAGEGTYTYDAVKKTVIWKTGPYANEKDWGGAFTVDREGKTHKIRLKRTTIATNSTDSVK